MIVDEFALLMSNGATVLRRIANRRRQPASTPAIRRPARPTLGLRAGSAAPRAGASELRSGALPDGIAFVASRMCAGARASRKAAD